MQSQNNGRQHKPDASLIACHLLAKVEFEITSDRGIPDQIDRQHVSPGEVAMVGPLSFLSKEQPPHKPP